MGRLMKLPVSFALGFGWGERGGELGRR